MKRPMFDFFGHTVEADANGFVDMTAMWESVGSPTDKTFSHWQHTDDGESMTLCIAAGAGWPATRLIRAGRRAVAYRDLAYFYGCFLSAEFEARALADCDRIAEEAIDAWLAQGKDWDWIKKQQAELAKRKPKGKS